MSGWRNSILFGRRSADRSWHHDTRLGGGVRHIPHPACGCGGQRGTCPTFWHSAAVCPRFDHGATGLGKDQRGTHAHPQLRVHYEFELIHPFADGNGRVGRLWHTLLLSKWNPAFAWLPVESIIHDRQQEYYDAINASNDAGDSTVFIEFMLSAIRASLMDAINTSDEMSDGKLDKATLRWNKIQEYLKTHDYIMNADVRELCGVSAATANRILANLVSEQKLVKYHEGGHWAYELQK